jgi:uncharacterized protein (DUF1501 family)
MTSHLNRRHFLRNLGGFGLAASPLAMSLAAMSQASAATASGYKALVCVFMYGGNDAYNTVLATDPASWSAYVAARGDGTGGSIALTAPGTPAASSSSAGFNALLGGALPIQPAHAQSRTFAVHPSLASVRDLFGAGRLAVLSNVGPLIGPTTKAAYLAGTAPLPPKLYSHNDQQSVWQSMAPEGSTRGWGGRMADLLLAGNGGSMFTSLSVSSQAVWLAGNQARQFQLSPGGVLQIGSPSGVLFNSALAQQTMLSLMSSARSANVMELDQSGVSARAQSAAQTLSAAMPAASAGPWGTAGLAAGATDPLLTYTDPSTGTSQFNPLAQQLQAVARMIATSSSLGVSRQVFFVSLGTFDTHDNQSTQQASMLAQLAQGLSYFDNVTRSMGVDQGVTTFTASDFGRTFQSNGDGTDHGWGSHHMIMGGAVRGGDIYGRFPTYGLSDGKGGSTSTDQLGAGAMLPSVSVEQYAATMGRWLGLTDAQLMSVLPALANWDPSVRNLGFLG